MKFPGLWSGNRNAPNLWSLNQGLVPESFWSLQGDLEEDAGRAEEGRYQARGGP